MSLYSIDSIDWMTCSGCILGRKIIFNPGSTAKSRIVVVSVKNQNHRISECIEITIVIRRRRAPHEVFLKKGVYFKIDLATNFQKLPSSYKN